MNPHNPTSIIAPQLAYAPERFVNREEEIAIAKKILTEAIPPTRILIVEGERGMGKTWLAIHLHRAIFSQLPAVISWLLFMSWPGESYTPWGDTLQEREHDIHQLAGKVDTSSTTHESPVTTAGNGEKLEEKVKECLLLLAKDLGLQMPSSPRLPEVSQLLLNVVRQNPYNRYVLILDSAYEADPAFLGALEEHFIQEFMSFANAFLILTGRGAPYPWRSPEFGRAKRLSLSPFEESQIAEQLQRLGFKGISPKEIHRLGRGSPLFTPLLAEAKNEAEALEKMVELVLAPLPSALRAEVRPYFEALCVLDGFREEHIPLFLEAYYNKPVTMSPSEARQARDAMLKTHLVTWKETRFVIAEPLRTLLENYLQKNEPEIWRRLHERALKYYQDLLNQPTLQRYRPLLEKHIQVHTDALRYARL